MIIGSKIRLRDKRLTDARDDYTWRADPELARLDAVPQLAMTFPEYLLFYIGELGQSSSNRRSFAIDTLGGKHIGSCVYYDINETKNEAEVGIMIGNHDYRDNGYGTDAITTLVTYVFRQTNLRRLYLKTLDSNIRAQKCFQKCGFISCGSLVRDGFSFVLMEIHRKQREGHHQLLKVNEDCRK